MTHVVTESCIKCKYTDCVDVCPVDCFREGPNFLVIDPDECIDCAVCIPECPVNAIYAEEDVPADQVKFIHGDAAGYVVDEKVSVAACIGATWIGTGVAGTIDLLAQSLRPGGIILIGEPYWRQLPPTEEVARRCLADSISDFLMLPELLASFGQLGYDVVEMVLADQDSCDRYEAAKWLTMRRWLEANPGDELANEVRAQLTSEPVRYAAYTREYLGWGVFALMSRQ